jgi:hypothetical protein
VVIDVGIEFVENDTNGWIEIDVSGLTPTKSDDPPETRVLPYRLLGNRFKSSSPDCELFIHDPLGVLLDARDNGSDQVRDVLRDVDEDWRVTTFLVNHEATLSNFHLLANVFVASSKDNLGAARRMSASDKTIAITLWKLAYDNPDATEGAVVRAAREAARR